MKPYRLEMNAACGAGLAGATVMIAGLVGCAAGLQERFQSHIEYLADDALEGRGLGSEGIEMAASYIAEQFAEIGLEPVGDDGGYFQSFTMSLQRELTTDTRLAFSAEESKRALHDEYIPFSFSSEDAFDGGVVFCGYGAVAPEHDHDDFAEVDLEGAVALILRGEPPSWGDDEDDLSRHAMFRNKVYNAKDRGAVAVLIVNQKPSDGEPDTLMHFRRRSGDQYGIPAFHIKRAVAEVLLQRGGLDSLDHQQERLDAGEVVSAPLGHVKAEGQAVFDSTNATVKNVLGLMRGTGPNADEYVVIGAHYDHLGLRPPMMRRFRRGQRTTEDETPQIHNGADDNASGVAGLIETARLFATQGRPERSLLFIAFTAEETGLHGSKHYIEHAAVPLDRTVAMLNMDMIGRMDPKERGIQVFGMGCGSSFTEILHKANRGLGLKIEPIQEPGGNSDHAAFVTKSIPSLHFFTGHHTDYHKPTDDSDKINAAGGAKVTRFVYRATGALANGEEKPEYIVVKTSEKKREGVAPSYKVVMGLAPGYVDDDQRGMAVDHVSPEGPAEQAGMKDGDRIVRIGDNDVANVYDYMAATRNNDPGDTVAVIVLRNGKEVSLQVTLAAP
ncbi:MAG: M20/M25/M40 family metallo-hydrolase [Planctomycetes bacterium]|nr:M20/M25/M40 family metallo-hydrolase [Planctomycetota bacterium]